MSAETSARTLFRRSPRFAPALVLAAALAVAMMPAPLAAASPEADFAAQSRCFAELAKGRSRDVVCEYPTVMTDEERGELRKLTREYLQDARCIVSIRIERARVAQALVAPDLVFDVPPQPVKCEIKTKSSVIPITGSFAPKVTIKGGQAVHATPGLGNVEGVSKYLAWPVVQYVNHAPSIAKEMLRMINQYRAGVAARMQQRADAR